MAPLDPDIWKEEWTADEDLKLVKIFETNRTQWRWYKNILKSRSPNNIKKRFYKILSRELQELCKLNIDDFDEHKAFKNFGFIINKIRTEN